MVKGEDFKIGLVNSGSFHPDFIWYNKTQVQFKVIGVVSHGGNKSLKG